MQTFETPEWNEDQNEVNARLINNFVITYSKYVYFPNDINSLYSSFLINDRSSCTHYLSSQYFLLL